MEDLSSRAVLEVRDLSIGFLMYEGRALTAPRRMVHAVRGLSLTVRAGEVLALVGASGSGKSLLADAVLGLFAANAAVTGSVRFEGEQMDARRWARLRGSAIAFVPQSVEALDPLMRVGAQLEGMALGATRAEAVRRRRELFDRYRLDESVAALYPFELSGGMARRVLLIGALMNEPRLLVADEPTPGLDQELAVRAMADLRAFAERGGAVLLITHDIELALRVAHRIAVFREGTVVEEAAVAQFAAPALLRHPFTRALWHALPEHDFAAPEGRAGCAGVPPAAAATRIRLSGEAGEEPAAPLSIAGGATGDAARPAGGAARSAAGSSVRMRRRGADGAAGSPSGDVPLGGGDPDGRGGLVARGLTFTYPCGRTVIDGVDFAVAPGERVAVCAPSGRGKTTLCRLLAGYLAPQAGEIAVDGVPLESFGRAGEPAGKRAGAGLARIFRRGAHPSNPSGPASRACPVQLVGQHPERMVDPILRVRESLAEALGGARPRDGRLEEALGALMDALGVRRAWLDRYPLELSGGELQRCCIVRALAARPRYLVCDEMTTMLDAVAQAQVWHAVIDLAEGRGMGLVVVSHAPALVDRIATRRFELPEHPL